ncbi:MAG TPA: YbhB/YbcL family Raf kinase inhibitor-like protein [Geobacteraceae bacterium]
MEFKLTSPAFNHGSQIPSKYTCDGDNINPHLVIHGAPSEARSLALLVEDPDAPAGPRVHWVVWDIAPDTKEIREHTAPFGAGEGINSVRKSGYSGPCPPSGTHRYFFRLFALDTKLKLLAGSGREQLETAMTGHIVATTELMGTYARTNEAPL